uniref:Fetuin B n=1 Tax=Anser cygnoides TaxID=8845 RepID=A0A8B9D1K0_ANSCY
MLLLISVLIGIQGLCSWAASPPARKVPSALLSPTCDDTAVEEAADLALRQINADRREGYILRLYRVFSVREHPQEITGSVFYLVLDVVDTECHVLSKKLWKNCTARPAHTTVYGQCKAIIYINQSRKIAHLNTYECVLQPVPPRYIWAVCPDCPVDDCPTEPKYLEAAVQSLGKFNGESEQTHYFSVLNVTRASMQWVIGPAYFVEFVIQETSCSKSDSIADISKCKPLSSELAVSINNYFSDNMVPRQTLVLFLRFSADKNQNPQVFLWAVASACMYTNYFRIEKNISVKVPNSYLEVHEQRKKDKQKILSRKR